MSLGRRSTRLGWWLCLAMVMSACSGSTTSPIVGRWQDDAGGSILTFTADGVMERDTGHLTFCYRLHESLFAPTTMTIQAIDTPQVTSSWTLQFDGPFLTATSPVGTNRYERIIEDGVPPPHQETGHCPPPR